MHDLIATRFAQVLRVVALAAVVIGMACAAPPVAAQVARPPVPLKPPAANTIPDDPLGASIRLGLAVLTDTQSRVKANVGNGLNCVSCHLDVGRAAYAAPLAGLTGMFPEYRGRTGGVESLEQRINDCFVRSMNGRALPQGSAEMIGLLAYTAWLSQGVPTGTEVVGRGFRDIVAVAKPDAIRGKALFTQKCAACHGANGQGTPGANNAFVFPPLWGPKSFNTGAGMARVSIAAAFVQAKMPLGAGGTLTDQEAYDIAAYFTAQPRPVFGASAKDWPKGGRPADAR
ncbi:MAG: c-type cytochrome [Casimicrobiaceae bacterium]